MIVYLDNCMFNRPFDDQSHIRIRLQELELVWSYILEFENAQNPHDERRLAIEKWKALSTIRIIETPEILACAKQLLEFNIKPKDALHVASAIFGKAEYFLSTDDKLVSAIERSKMITALRPTDYINKVLDK